MAQKFFIYYNNGQFETTDKINITLIHMVEIGVIKIIFDCVDNKAWVRLEDGTSKEIKVTNVGGLA